MPSVPSLPLPVTIARGQGAPPASRWIEHLANRWVGFWERRRSFASPRAYREFLDYYERLYQERGPDPARFYQLLVRNGVPVLANPFPDSTPEHYLYHPDGLVMADLEAVLNDVPRAWSPVMSLEEEPQADGPQWPTLAQAEEGRQALQRQTQTHWAGLAGVAWGLVILHARKKDLDWLRHRVHADNLAWATVHALRHAPWQEWGVDSALVLVRAVALDLLPHGVAIQLFPDMAKELADAS